MTIKPRFFILIMFLAAFIMELKAQKIVGDSSLKIHKVKQTENIRSICDKYKCNANQLQCWNKLKSDEELKPGQILWIWQKKQLDDPNQITLFDNDTSRKWVASKLPPPKIIVNTHTDTPATKQIKPYKKLAFEGTRLIQAENKLDTSGTLTFSGYLSTYYALYSDSTGYGQYQKFPTSSPLNNSFSLNMIYFGAKYSSSKIRGNVGMHWGDIADCAWSNKYNFIQEANVGAQLLKGLWVDAGYFRTHLGLESIQPRENITSSIATTTYFEPYYLSGLKLTYYVNKKLALQASIFDGFNTFIENNKNKAVCVSFIYAPNDQLNLTFNSLTCDESPDEQIRKQLRNYNNFYISYKSPKFDFGAELNYGFQKNTKLIDSLKTAYMFSALMVARYHLSKKIGFYLRTEYFDDRDEILTGPVQNEYHQLVGIHDWGITPGLELAPIQNSYLRLEYRYIDMLENNETIFYYHGTYRKFRHEAICSLGIWF